MSLVQEQRAFVKDVCSLLAFIERSRFFVTFGEAYRPDEMQKIYVAQGKAQTMKNSHGNRLAIDLNFFDVDGKLTYDKSALQFIGDYWTALSPKNIWGGNWKSLVDTPHFERKVS